MQKYLAIDTVLLPPKQTMEEIIRINGQLVDRYQSPIILNTVNCLPHLTLSQAVISETDLFEKAAIRLKTIAKLFSPLKLKLKLIQGLDDTHSDSVYLMAEPDKLLQALHVRVMESFKDLVSYKPETEYYYNSEISQNSMDWLRNFVKNSAYDNFDAHITVGKGSLDKDMVGEVIFTADRLTICQLGNYNTCRKILVDTKLGLN